MQHIPTTGLYYNSAGKFILHRFLFLFCKNQYSIQNPQQGGHEEDYEEEGAYGASSDQFSQLSDGRNGGDKGNHIADHRQNRSGNKEGG